jgi:hypothetical protein
MTTQTRWDPARIADLIRMMKPAAGDIFYVNGNDGSNSNDGTTPETAFLTISYAMDQCTDGPGQNDYIVVVRYPSAGAVGEVWPIAVDVESVHVIGAGLFGASVYAWIAPPDDTAAFVISKHGVEIAGFDLGAGVSHGCIENSGAIWRAHIHHNDFAVQRTAQDGIKLTGVGNDCPHWLIEDNTFCNYDTPNIARNHIRIEHNSTRSIIRRNLFRVGVGAVGIHLQGLCTGHVSALDNNFLCNDNAAGEAITLSATATGYFSGNVAGQGKAAMINNPYLDANGTGNWGANYQPGALILPA